MTVIVEILVLTVIEDGHFGPELVKKERIVHVMDLLILKRLIMLKLLYLT
jgi:hypothetical protein